MRKSCSEPSLLHPQSFRPNAAATQVKDCEPSVSGRTDAAPARLPVGARWRAFWRKDRRAAQLQPADSHTYDVFVAVRKFESFGGEAFRSLPVPVHEMLVDIGVCHFMALFRCGHNNVWR